MYAHAAQDCGMTKYVDCPNDKALVIYHVLTEAGTSFMSTSEPWATKRRIYLSAASEKALKDAQVL